MTPRETAASITPQALTTHINIGSQPTWLAADSLQFSERVAAVAVIKDDFSVVTFRCYPSRSQRPVLVKDMLI
jgi:hypothetical protein